MRRPSGQEIALQLPGVVWLGGENEVSVPVRPAPEEVDLVVVEIEVHVAAGEGQPRAQVRPRVGGHVVDLGPVDLAGHGWGQGVVPAVNIGALGSP